LSSTAFERQQLISLPIHHCGTNSHLEDKLEEIEHELYLSTFYVKCIWISLALEQPKNSHEHWLS